MVFSLWYLVFISSIFWELLLLLVILIEEDPEVEFPDDLQPKIDLLFDSLFLVG